MTSFILVNILKAGNAKAAIFLSSLPAIAMFPVLKKRLKHIHEPTGYDFFLPALYTRLLVSKAFPWAFHSLTLQGVQTRQRRLDQHPAQPDADADFTPCHLSVNL